MIFQFYPLPGLPSEGDYFYYNREVDLSCGNIAALVTYATHYDLPLVVHARPNIAAFQVACPWANICPFSKVSPRILSRGRELFALAHLAAQVAPVILPSVAHSTPSSRKGSLSMGSSSLLSPASLLAASRGVDPPSLPHSSISLLAVPEGRFFQVGGFPHVGPHRPNPNGIDAPSPSGGSWSRLWAPYSQGGGISSLLSPLGASSSSSRGLPTHSPHGGIPPPAHGGHPTHAPHGGISPSAHGGLPTHAPHPLGGASLCWHLLPSIVGASLPSLVAFPPTCLPSSIVVVFWSLPSISALPMHLHMWRHLLGYQVQCCILCRMRMLGLCWLPTVPCLFWFQFLP